MVPFSTTDLKLADTFPADDLFGGISGDDTIVGGAGPTIFRTKPTDQGGFNSAERAVNQVPVADAGPDQVVNVGDTVQLEGSFTDPDNTGGDSVHLDGTQQLRSNRWPRESTQAFSFVPTTPDLYFATFTVTDALGGSGQATARVTAGQVTPTIAISGATTTTEGSIYQLNLATAGISPDAITGWTINWGDGTSDQVPGNPSQVLHTYADGPAIDIISASALAGTSAYPAAANVTISIGNVAPTAVMSSSGPVLEGSTATVNFADPYDPSFADTVAGFTYSYDFDNDGTFDLVTSSSTATVPAALTADGPTSVTVHGRITDRDGDYTDYATTIAVINLAPSAVLSIDSPPAGQTIEEGDTITARFTGATDPSPADLAAGLRFTFEQDPAKLATSYATAGTDNSARILLLDDGVQVVYGRVFDKDGGITNLIATVQVAGVAPVATLSNNGPTTEGGSALVGFSTPDDPSSADTSAGFRYSFALDPSLLAVSYYARGILATPTVTFVPRDNGTYTIYGRVFDKDNLYTQTTTIVNVSNVAPSATMADTGPILEGGQVLVGLLGANDPSPFDAVAGFHYSFALDPSALSTTYDDALTSYWTVIPLGDNGSYTIYGRIFDKDNGYTDYTTSVTVNNVAPTATLSNSGPVVEGSPVTISFSNGSDPSPADIAAGFHYSFATTQAALATGYSGADIAPTSIFTFTDHGSYTVYGRILDKDNGYTDFTTTVTVSPRKVTALSDVSGSGVYGSVASLTGSLTGDGSPLAGKPVTFHLLISGIDTVVGTATTNGSGIATLANVSLMGFQAGTFVGIVSASFALDTDDAASTGSGDLVVGTRSLTVSATGVDKVYDGTTAATVTLSDDRVAGDALTISYASALFADKNVGTGKLVTVTGIAITGATAGNYTLANTTASTTASITKATANITLGNLSYLYDGSAHYASATTTPTGLAVNIVYSQNGATVTSPTNAGSYLVTATINDPNYQGNATSTLVIGLTFRIGSTGIDVGNAVITDPAGNVYLTGSFKGTVDFDPGAGITNLTSAGAEDIFVAKYAPTGVLLWAKRLGGAGIDTGVGIAVDGSGNVFTTGVFTGTADFDPGSATANLTSAGLSDVFVSKLTSTGALGWAERLGGGGIDAGSSIAVDGSGNVFTTGVFTGTADFDPGSAHRQPHQRRIVRRLRVQAHEHWRLGLGRAAGWRRHRRRL